MKHGTGTKACLDTAGEVGTALVHLRAVSIATKLVWACLHWTAQVCTLLLSCDKQPALYPGLLAPVFIASSANVGYGLVKLVTSLDIRWMAGGVSSDFRIGVQLLSAPEKHVTVAVVAVVACWGSRLVECSLTRSSRECASPSDIHLRFMNMTTSFTGHSTTSVLQVLGREGCGYDTNKPPSCTLAWFTK